MSRTSNTKADGAAVKVEAEVDETIHVGAGGTLVVPREDIGAGIVEGVDLDIASKLPIRIRKPGRREFVKVNRGAELQTRLLHHRPNPEAMDVEHYYVSMDLRPPIIEELKGVRVFPYWSLATKTHALWVVNVNPDNRWYESLNLLFQQGDEFFKNNAVRIVSDKIAGLYHVKFRAVDVEVVWPDASTEELLGEALGHDHFITSPDHPVYADLVAGTELT